MTAYDKLKAARRTGRPTGKMYVEQLFEDRIVLCGDRRFGEDSAIFAGLGYLSTQPCVFIAIDKGSDTNERINNNFGCPKPEGYRKALRIMKQAEKFHLPVVCFVDTMGAYCGAEGEERGQGQAIAENIMEMSALRTPIVSIVVGEGGSGGALALCVADRVYMLENSVYSVISPEGCASILWKDSSRVADAAESLRITAQDMVDFGVAERIIPEDFADFDVMCNNIREHVLEDIKDIFALGISTMLDCRYDRFRRIGVYEEAAEKADA